MLSLVFLKIQKTENILYAKG